MVKTLPGQIYASDTNTPSDEPLYSQAFILEAGTVSCETGNDVVVGTDTHFTTDVSVGQSLLIHQYSVKIAAIQDDTTLVLTAPWPGEPVSHQYAYVYKLRPFSEFFGKYVYPETYPLGNSGLVLRDIMPNFKRPVHEVLSTAGLPNWANDPNSTANTTNPDDTNSTTNPKTKKPLPSDIELPSNQIPI